MYKKNWSNTHRGCVVTFIPPHVKEVGSSLIKVSFLPASCSLRPPEWWLTDAAEWLASAPTSALCVRPPDRERERQGERSVNKEQKQHSHLQQKENALKICFVNFT